MFSPTPLRIALCGIGLQAYWEQFDGLKAELEGYLRVSVQRLAGTGAEVVELGLVDSYESAVRAGRQCRQSEAEILFLYVTTYALSSTVLTLVQRASIPVIVLNLQPRSAIDYDAFNRLPSRQAMTGFWLRYCSACSVPEIANLFERAGIPFLSVTGVLDADKTWDEISDWVQAARVKNQIRNSCLGLMGHYYSGMLDVATDITQLCISFGLHTKLLEVDELSAIRKRITEEAIAERVIEFQDVFDIQSDCPTSELARAAHTSVALDRFVEQHRLDSLAYYYKGNGNEENEDTMSSIILGTSRLTGRHLPVAGEYEVKNAVAMKILDVLGAGGSFTEVYALDYEDDIVLMGHDGPGHIGIAQGKIHVRPLSVYHGKVGRGLSIEMSVRYGPVTLLSVAEAGNKGYQLLAAHGVCEEGPTLAIGNTNSRIRFSIGAGNFVDAWNRCGPAHHCAIGIGHIAGRIEKFAQLVGLPFRQIC